MKKFNIDKRKISLSSQVCTGKIAREMALEKIKQKPYPEDKIKEDLDYVLKKIELSKTAYNFISTAGGFIIMQNYGVCSGISAKR